MDKMKPMEPMKPMKPMEPMKPMKQQAPWWPDKLGQPDSSGGQNDTQYAYFGQAHRLAVKTGDKIEIYDTGAHRINGVAQQQGQGSSLSFNSDNGTVDLSSLKRVDD
jgi:hypothetical protein